MQNKFRHKLRSEYAGVTADNYINVKRLKKIHQMYNLLYFMRCNKHNNNSLRLLVSSETDNPAFI